MNHFAPIHFRAARTGSVLVKTCLAGCLLAGAAQTAKCQEGSTNGGVHPRTELHLFPVRVFGDTALNLTPLVQWWDQATLARRADVDGQPYTNQLPRRPLTDWFRIKGDYVQDAYAGWQINATIEDYPGHSRQAVIIVRRPPAMALSALIRPRQEIQREIDRLSVYARHQDSVDAARQSASTNQITENQNAYAIALLNGETAQGASNEVAHSGGPILESTEHHDAEVRIAQLREQLDQLPEINEHRVDFFAAKVGYITGTHFEAFDFGDLPFGGVQ